MRHAWRACIAVDPASPLSSIGVSRAAPAHATIDPVLLRLRQGWALHAARLTCACRPHRPATACAPRLQGYTLPACMPLPLACASGPRDAGLVSETAPACMPGSESAAGATSQPWRLRSRPPVLPPRSTAPNRGSPAAGLVGNGDFEVSSTLFDVRLHGVRPRTPACARRRRRPPLLPPRRARAHPLRSTHTTRCCCQPPRLRRPPQPPRVPAPQLGLSGRSHD